MSSSVTLNSACRPPRFQQAKAARSQSADLETTLAGGGLAPVARNHDSGAAEQKKDLLVVAMPMDSDPALGLQEGEGAHAD